MPLKGQVGSGGGGGGGVSTPYHFPVPSEWWQYAYIGGESGTSPFSYGLGSGELKFMYCVPFTPALSEYDEVFIRLNSTEVGASLPVCIYEVGESGSPVGAPVMTVNVPMDTAGSKLVALPTNFVPVAGKRYYIAVVMVNTITALPSLYRVSDCFAHVATTQPWNTRGGSLRVSIPSASTPPVLTGDESTFIVGNSFLLTALKGTATSVTIG